MRSTLPILILSLCLTCCSSGGDKAVDGKIAEYLAETISHPETYKAENTTYIGRGKMDRSSFEYWREEPALDSVEVRAYYHEFTHRNRANDLVEDAWYFYFSEDLELIYTAHFDQGTGPADYFIQK